jgi:type VI secretion system protein ImpM
VSQPLARNQTAGRDPAITGFYGKIPARGDFVRAGLRGRFVDPWHCWMQRMLAQTRAALGEAWLPAWLEAPIWQFAFAAGVCGPDPAIGLWMPSVDRVGRHFPLAAVMLAPHEDPGSLLRQKGPFLAAAEQAGLDALERDIGPDELAARLASAARNEPGAAAVDPGLLPASGALWWTAGAPRVPAAVVSTTALPDAMAFAAMLDAETTIAQSFSIVR